MINFSEYIKRLNYINFDNLKVSDNILPLTLEQYKLNQLKKLTSSFGDELKKSIDNINNTQTKQIPSVNSEEVSKLSMQNQYRLIEPFKKKEERKPNYTVLRKREEHSKDNKQNDSNKKNQRKRSKL